MSAAMETLIAENAVLRHRLDALTGRSQITALREAFGFTGKQAALVGVLMNCARTVSREAIYAAVFEHDNGDGPNDAIINVVVSKVRRRLEEFKAPGRIDSIYGAGYSMSPDLRDWVSARVSV